MIHTAEAQYVLATGVASVLMYCVTDEDFCHRNILQSKVPSEL